MEGGGGGAGGGKVIEGEGGGAGGKAVGMRGAEKKGMDLLSDQDSDENILLGEESHHEDSACALCRRCQMRKRLEKKVAERNALRGELEREYGYREVSKQELRVEAREDERSIEELLVFINGYEGTRDGSKSKKGRSKRKSKRKEEGEGKVIGSYVMERDQDRHIPYAPGPGSPNGSLDASRSSRPKVEVPPGMIEDLTSGESSPTQASKDFVRGSVLSLPDDINELQLPTYAKEQCNVPEIPPEVEEEIQREVEDFRRRLAEASASFVGNKLKPVLILNTHCVL